MGLSVCLLVSLISLPTFIRFLSHPPVLETTTFGEYLVRESKQKEAGGILHVFIIKIIKKQL